MQNRQFVLFYKKAIKKFEEYGEIKDKIYRYAKILWIN